MSQAALKYDLRQVERLKAALQKVSAQSFRPMMESLAHEVETQTLDRFNRGEGPEGPWEDWSEKYAERVAGQRTKILVRRGSSGLMGSIRGERRGNSMLIGSHMPHAATHQYGDDARGIPARPYLGITPEDESDLVDIVNDFIDGLFPGAA